MLATQVEATPRFIITLNASAAPQGAIRVPLAITGKWVRGATTFAITRQDLESIVHNFRERQNGEINVDYDHASEMPEVAAGGPVPSAGRIVRLDAPEQAKNGSGKLEIGNGEKEPDFLLPTSHSRSILYGWYEPTARARQLLQNREYRFISPAIEWSAKNKRSGRSQGTTLTSVALTNRPFLEELPQIRLSDPGFQPVNEDENRNWKLENGNSKLETRNPKLALERGPVTHPDGSARRDSNFHLPVSNYQFPVSTQGGSMKHVNLSVVDGQIHITHEDLGDEFYFDADDLQSVGALREAPLQASSAALSESAVVTFAQARTLLSEAEARDKFIPAAEVFRAAAEQELDDAVRAGKILPRQRDDWRKIALSDLPTFRKLMGAQKAVVPLAPVGLAGTPPSDVQEQVKFLAEQRMRERHTTFGQALSDIGREQPDLVQQYRKAVSSND
jgi:hypothetical protein